MRTIRSSIQQTADTCEVQLWQIVLSDSSMATACAAALLSEAELRRVRRFKFLSDQRAYVQGHGALRILLARQLDTDPAALSFENGPWGKPFLAGEHADRGLHFSLSRTRGTALVGIAWGREIGVDIEAVRKIHALSEMAASEFTPVECQVLDAVTGRDRAIAFLNMWTAKEAGLKGVGKGLFCPPARVPLTLDAGGRIIGIDLESARSGVGQWSIVPLPAGPDYVAAIAAPGAIVPNLVTACVADRAIGILSR